MATNAAKFPAIEALAVSLGLPFRMDVAILPRLNGDAAPLSLRVPAEEAVRIEFSDPARRQKWARYLSRYVNCRPPMRAILARLAAPISTWIPTEYCVPA